MNKEPVTFASVGLRYYTADEFGRGVALALGLIPAISPFDVPDQIDQNQARRWRTRILREVAAANGEAPRGGSIGVLDY